MTIKAILKKTLDKLKEMSSYAIIRLFNSKRKRYDEALKRLDSLNSLLASNMVSLSSDDYDIDLEDDEDDAPSVKTSTKSKKPGGVKVVNVGGDEDFVNIEPTSKTPVKIRKGKRSSINAPVVRHGDGHSVVLDSFTTPKIKTLEANVQILNEVEQIIQEIDALSQALAQHKDKNPARKQTIEQMATYRDSLVEKAQQAHDSLAEIADKHLPPLVQAFAKSAVVYLDTTLPKETYSDLNFDVHVTPNNDGLTFTYYIGIEDLDHDQFQTEEMFIVLTTNINKLQSKEEKYVATLHVTALNKFQRPGMFKVGKRITGTTIHGIENSLHEEMSRLLAMHGLSSVVGRTEIPVTTAKLKASGIMAVTGISDVYMKNGEAFIELTLPITKAKEIKATIWPEVIVNIRRVARIPKNYGFAYELIKKDGVTTMQVFALRSFSKE